jgi:general secretion pathway protein K
VIEGRFPLSSMRGHGFRRPRGAALLMAMLTVTLVATFAAAALWQQWRSIEVETSERARVQSAWLLTGALDWARLVLREDARPRGSTIDHLGEPWAVPLQEARLSSFLAADHGASQAETGSDVLDAFLSGQVIDLQSLLIVNNLIDATTENHVRTFERLFRLLGLPLDQLNRLVANIRRAASINPADRAIPLMPQKVDQLIWLGLTAQTVEALRPYITVLPLPPGAPIKVNLNTASAEVIYASIDGLGMADAQRLVAVRERTPFHAPDEARQAIGASNEMFAAGQVAIDVKSSYFEVRSRLRFDQLVVEERAVLQRADPPGFDVKTLWRVRGIPAATAPSQTNAMR